MDYLVTINQMDDSFRAVMQSLKNQIEIHYDEVRKVAKKADAIFNDIETIAQEVSTKTAELTSKEIYNNVNTVYGAANVMAIDAQLTE